MAAVCCVMPHWIAPEEMRRHIVTGVEVMYDEARLWDELGK
jgi:hypothetical protein